MFTSRNYVFTPIIKKNCIIIFLIAIILRSWIISTTTFIPASDQRDYHVLAKNLYDGEGYIQIYIGESPQFHGMTFRAYRMPGYPVLLAGFYKLFGPNPKFALWLNLIFDLGSLVLIFLIMRFFGGGLIAPLLFALTPIWTPLLMTESLFTSLFLLLLYLILVQGKDLLAGVILAFSVMVKPIAISVLPFLLVRKRTVLLLAPLFIVLTAWNIRNYNIFNRPVFLSTNFGSHNAQDFGIDKMTEIVKLREQGLGEVEINNQLTNQIKSKIKEDPKIALSVYLARLKQLFSTKPPSELRSLLWKDGLKYPKVSKVILGSMPYLYLLALISLPVCFYKNPKPTLILFGCALSFILLHPLVSHGNIRFFAPIFPILCIFIGGAWRR